MATLEAIEQESAYAAGDPWTPGDPNLIAYHSGAFRDVALVEHRDDGTHASLDIPIAYALITYTAGPTYTVTKGYNVTTGTGAITILGTGRVTIAFNVAVLSKSWMSVDIAVGPTDNAEFGYKDDTGTNDTTNVTVQLFDSTIAAVDRSFGIAIYGSRSA